MNQFFEVTVICIFIGYDDVAVDGIAVIVAAGVTVCVTVVAIVVIVVFVVVVSVASRVVVVVLVVFRAVSVGFFVYN